MGSGKELWNNDLTQLSTQSWVASWSSGHTVSNSTLLATTKISWHEEFGQSFGWKIKNHRTAFEPMHFCSLKVLSTSRPPLPSTCHPVLNSAPSFQNSRWARDAADAPKDVWSQGGSTYAMPKTVPYFWPSFPFFLHSRCLPSLSFPSRWDQKLQTLPHPADSWLPSSNCEPAHPHGSGCSAHLFPVWRSVVLSGPYGSDEQNIQNHNPTKHAVFIIYSFFHHQSCNYILRQRKLGVSLLRDRLRCSSIKCPCLVLL